VGTVQTLLRRVHRATSLPAKLFVPLGLLVVLACGLLAGLGYRAQRAALTARYVERARGVAVLFDHEFGELDYDLTDTVQVGRHVSHLLTQYPDIARITIYAPVGDTPRALYSSDPEIVGTEARPHDVEPLQTGRPHIHETEHDGLRLLEVTFPLHRDGRVVAAVGVYTSLAERDRQLQRYLRWAGSTAAGTLTGVIGLLYLVVQAAVATPLRRTLARAERLAAGELPPDIPAVPGSAGVVRDEMERFDRALDTVVRRLLADRAQIRVLAVTDPLTGLHNRRFFDEIIQREVARAQREGQPFAVALVDVDGLREVNNRHGHLAGDDLLRRAGRFLRSHVRAADDVIRWGGDEFLILMPRTDHARAAAVARRLVAAAAAGGDGGTPSLAFSIGVAAWRPGRSVEEVLREADAAMYRHKARSRRSVRGRACPGPEGIRSGGPRRAR
jgi:diguanylate cyclase (GGDEF)-like protein